MQIGRKRFFSVACSKNCFLPWTMEMIRGSCWLSFRSTPIREYLRVPYWLLFNVCPAIYAFPHFESRTPNVSVFYITAWSFWCRSCSLGSSVVLFWKLRVRPVGSTRAGGLYCPHGSSTSVLRRRSARAPAQRRRRAGRPGPRPRSSAK